MRKLIFIIILVVFMSTGLRSALFAAATENDTSAQDTPADTDTFESSSQSAESAETESEQTVAMASESSDSSAGQGSPSINSILSSFQTDLYTGKASLSVPIQVPAGRRGIQPALNLIYQSGGPNTWCGKGWMLDTGSISRSTKRGVPKYDSTDTFVFNFSGASQELVEIATNEYRAKIESAFMKFEYLSDHWVVTDKSGTKYYFGQSQDSRQEKSVSDIYSWYLDKVIDVHNNYMTMEYTKDVHSHGTMLYLNKIMYTGYDSSPGYYSVEFSLEEREDHINSQRPGFSQYTQYRLKDVVVLAGNVQVKKYSISYKAFDNSTHKSLIESITQYGKDDTKSLPSATFTYQDARVPTTETYYNMYTTDMFYSDRQEGSQLRKYTYGDFNGDGLTDLAIYIKENGTVKVYLNQPGNFLVDNGVWLNYQVGDPGKETSFDNLLKLFSGDFDGDGKSDIAFLIDEDEYNAYNKVMVSMSTGSSFSSPAQWMRDDCYMEGELLAGEFNGDSKTDIIFLYYSSNRVNSYGGTSTGSSFTSSTRWFYFDTGWNPSQYMAGDFNGDGFTDICFYEAGSGEWAFAIMESGGGCQTIYPRVHDFGRYGLPGQGWQQVGIGDFNGDGLVDIYCYDSSNRTMPIRINNGYEMCSLGSASTGDTYLDAGVTVDYTGDGITDTAFRCGSNYIRGRSFFAEQSDLLVSVDNGLGATTSITYKVYKGLDNTDPAKKNKLPFPIRVVDTITSTDSVTGDSFQTSYDYDSGIYDFEDKEFRGFGFVKVTDHVGNYSEAYFKQDDIFKGKTYSQKAYDSSSTLLTQSDTEWASEQLHNGTIEYPYASQSDSYSYDGGITKHTRQRAQFSFSNNLIDSAVTYVEGDVDDTSDDKTSYTYFTHNTIDWILSLPYETELKDANSNIISKQRIYYDSSGSLGETPVKGLPTKQSVWLNLPTGKWISSTTEYNDYGNVISTTDPRGNSISTIYDSTLNQYPITITNELGHTQNFTYDYSTGAILTSTDPNSQITTNVYDSLGRLLEIYGPLDTDGIASVIYEYDSNSIPNRVTKKVKKEYNSSDYIITYSFSDGFQRVLESRSPAEPDGATSRQIISGIAKYNYQGKVIEEYKGYFESSSSDYTTPNYTGTKTSYTYDVLGRVKTITTQNEEGSYIQASNSYSGWTVTSIDFKGNKKESYYDAFGKLIKITEYNNTSSYNTYYEYGALGNLEKVTDNQGNVTTISYDSLGRKLSMSDPDMGVWSYAYDDNGNLSSQTDAKDQTIYFAYDAINRLTQKQTPDAITTYTYDQGLNSIGRLSSVSYSGGDTSFTYDELGREIQTQKTINSTNYTIERTYDALDRLKTLSYPDGEVLTYTYGISGAIKKIEGLVKTYVEDIIYNAQGQMTKLTYGNGSITNYTYSPYTQRLANLLTTDSESLNIQDLSYTFDNVGNITQIDDAINTATQSFSYDNLNRLTQANNQSGYGTLNYAYDSIGNLIEKGSLYFNYGENSAGPHAVTSSTDGSIVCSYDDNGNMLNKNLNLYTYDSENRLSSVEKPVNSVHDTYQIELSSGWNFFSLPVVPDGYNISDSIPISDVLSSIAGYYSQVTRYNPSTGLYESYVGDSEHDQFSSMEYLRGYQIYCEAPATLTITGSSPNTTFNSSLGVGSNLVGVDISNNGKAASAAFFNIDYSSIKWYNPQTETLEDVAQEDTVYMGRCYWVDVTSSSTYSVTSLEDTTTFTYDGDGGRVRKSVNGISTYYVGSLFEKKRSTTTRHIFLGSTRVCSVTSTGTTSYYHGDHLGSSTDITDNSGELSQHTEYTPYGEFSATDSTFGDVTPYLYTGQLYDSSTELYYYGARYYDPQLGRFITADTIVPDPGNSQAFNRYSYTENNPINYTDPTGHFSFKKWIGKIIGAIVGTIAAIVTGNPLVGMQVYSAVSSVIDSAIAIANGANVFRMIGSIAASFALASILPGGETYANLGMQVAVHAARGAVIGAATAAIMGGDIGAGALGGGIAGAAIGFASSNQVQSMFKSSPANAPPASSQQEVKRQAQEAAGEGNFTGAGDAPKSEMLSVEGGKAGAEAIAKEIIRPISSKNAGVNGDLAQSFDGPNNNYITSKGFPYKLSGGRTLFPFSRGAIQALKQGSYVVFDKATDIYTTYHGYQKFELQPGDSMEEVLRNYIKDN